MKASLKIVENSKYKVIRIDKTYLTKFAIKNWQIYEKEPNLKMTRIMKLIIHSHHDLFDHQNTLFPYPLCIFRFIDSKETANLTFHVNKQAHYDPRWSL